MEAMTLSDQKLPMTMPQGAWGTEDISAKDILIPKLLLMQGLSDLVVQQKARLGEMVNSTTAEVLGDPKKPVELIPLTSFKTWVNYEVVGNRGERKFLSIEPITHKNEDLPLEDMINGKKIRRDYCLNFYVLLTKEIGQADILPYLITFKVTGLTAGKKLVTHCMKARALQVPPAKTAFNLTCTLRENDQGKFYVFDVEKTRETSDKELGIAWEWFQRIRGGVTRVDDSDLSADVEAAAVTENSQF